MTMFKDEAFLKSFEEMQKAVHKNATTHGFWDDAGSKNFGEQIALMHSELSEALEADRKSLMSEKLPGFTGVEEELADTVIRIMDTAKGLGLRLPEAILAKHEFNKGRPFKHGGKKY